MRKLLIIAGLLFCNIAQAKSKFKVGECLISKTDSDKVDPWQLDNVLVYKIDKVGKASYKTTAILPAHRDYLPDHDEIIEFSRENMYMKESCKKFLGE